jgi:hypothetical protein
MRFAIALCLALFSLVCVFAAVANLYNIDGYRPAVLLLYGAVGILALGAAARLAKQSQSAREKSIPPAA